MYKNNGPDYDKELLDSLSSYSYPNVCPDCGRYDLISVDKISYCKKCLQWREEQYKEVIESMDRQTLRELHDELMDQINEKN